MNDNQLWRSLSNSALVRFLLLFACGWALVQLIAYFYTVIAMFVTAAILAVLMDYPVRKLSMYIPRWLAITMTVLGTVAIALGFITILGLQVINQGSTLVQSITTGIQSSNLPFKDYLERINFDQIIGVLRSSLSTGLGLVGTVFSNTFTAIFLLVIAIYMLVDGRKIWAACLKLLPGEVREQFDRNVQRNFLGFLRGQITLVIFLSVASFIVYTILGVQFSLILAIVVGVLDAIPGIGATLGVVIVTTLVFLTQGQWVALQVVIASVILQQIQDNVVHPRVMGKALEINPVLLFFALFIGERVAGLLGIFLAIPIAGMIVSWSKDKDDTPAIVAADATVTITPTSNPSEEEIRREQ
ncbi:MAG: AI-2E family transporter [Leptolyngbyaceae cyanobacterium bins.302]|nr:AI-2E family transporter [Leptolyngbyaceae cyanobacterium bins.302]